MKLIPYDRSKIGKKRRGANQAIIEEFVNSGHDCVKIENYTHKSAESCEASFGKSIQRSPYKDSVDVCIRKGEVFLVKKIL